MKKRQVLHALIGILLVFFLATTVHAQTVTLRFAHQNPDSGWSSINCSEPWFRDIEKATNGKVKIQGYYGQTLAKGKDIWNATKSGITDMGWHFHGYWPGMTPLADVISLPALGFRTAEKASEVLWKLYEKFPEIQNEFKDVKVLLLYSSPPYGLITTNKQVKTLEDIKGLKIRMTGGPPTDMVKALGGVPMLIPMPDNYLSLQKGVIDGMGAPWEAIQAFRLYEVVKYHTDVPFPGVYFSIGMNKAKWDSLPKDVQDGIMSVSGLAGSKFWGRLFFDALKNVAMESMKKQGIELKLHDLSPQERQKWLEIGGKPIWDQWVKEMQGKGFANAQKILDTAVELSK